MAIFKDFCFSLALKSINVTSYFFKIFFNLLLNTFGTFLSKTKESIKHKLDTEKDNLNDKKNINDQFSKKLSVDNNERLAFIKHLFNGDKNNYERVLNQTLTLDSWPEVSNLISSKVKIEYNNWKGKEDIADRFLAVLQKSFES